jgi:hypothetical protein
MGRSMVSSREIPELMEVYSWKDQLHMVDLQLPCFITGG